MSEHSIVWGVGVVEIKPGNFLNLLIFSFIEWLKCHHSWIRLWIHLGTFDCFTTDSLATRLSNSCRLGSQWFRSAATRCCSPCRHRLLSRSEISQDHDKVQRTQGSMQGTSWCNQWRTYKQKLRCRLRLKQIIKLRSNYEKFFYLWQSSEVFGFDAPSILFIWGLKGGWKEIKRV